MNSSRRAGSDVEQSLSLSGIPAPSSSDLARTCSRTWAAARRAVAPARALATILLASAGCSSSHSPRQRLLMRSTNERIEVFRAGFGLPIELGFADAGADDSGEPLADVFGLQVGVFFSLITPRSRHTRWRVRVHAALNPCSWVPPSMVDIPLAKLCNPSLLNPGSTGKRPPPRGSCRR